MGLLSSLTALSMKFALRRCFSFLRMNLGLYTKSLVCRLEMSSHYNESPFFGSLKQLKAAVFWLGRECSFTQRCKRDSSLFLRALFKQNSDDNNQSSKLTANLKLGMDACNLICQKISTLLISETIFLGKRSLQESCVVSDKFYGVPKNPCVEHLVCFNTYGTVRSVSQISPA